jgi:membrane protease YdiL (CAAX protease family)
MRVVWEIVLLFILPVIPGFFKSVPKWLRFYIFALMVLVAGIIVYLGRWPLAKIGIDSNNLLNGWQWYALFTILGLGYIFALAKILKLPKTKDWWRQPHFLFGFILMSAGQEFYYRGFLMPELKLIFSGVLVIILINALLFAFIHAVFPNKFINVTSSFLGGLCFAGLYYFYPNLLLISLSHMALNFCAVYFGLFTFRKS